MPANTKYVQLRFNSNEGVKTVWAQKLGKGYYRQVNEEGDWGLDSKDRRIIVSEQDIIFEKPATINNKYGILEIIPTLLT